MKDLISGKFWGMHADAGAHVPAARVLITPSPSLLSLLSIPPTGLDPTERRRRGDPRQPLPVCHSFIYSRSLRWMRSVFGQS